MWGSSCRRDSSFWGEAGSWATLCRPWVLALVFLNDQRRGGSILSHWTVPHSGLHRMKVVAGKRSTPLCSSLQQ